MPTLNIKISFRIKHVQLSIEVRFELNRNNKKKKTLLAIHLETNRCCLCSEIIVFVIFFSPPTTMYVVNNKMNKSILVVDTCASLSESRRFIYL